MSTDRAEERRGEIFLVFLRQTKYYITDLIIVGYFFVDTAETGEGGNALV